MNPSYTSQNSISSIESNDSEVSSSSNTMQYGPIQVRLCRKMAPTLETGRRSKHLVLSGEEAARRERRREKNRDAAKKLKEKRLLIEEELNQKLRELEDQNSDLQTYLQHLKQRREDLQIEVNHLIDPMDELLSNDDNNNMSLFIEKYLNNFDFCDETIDDVLNIDIDISFNCITHN